MYSLASAEQRAKEHPKSFQIPPARVRLALQAGYMVKLIFTQKKPPAGERMWVEVTGMERDAAGVRYVGILKNRPSTIFGVKFGDKVEFSPEHIAGVDIAED
jgi:uncharacterized protein YegJ (DUF2314 family)